jgi:hypothetical protein
MKRKPFILSLIFFGFIFFTASESWSISNVEFGGTALTNENSEPWKCYETPYVELNVTEILVDPDNELSIGQEVTVHYDEPQGLKIGDKLEVSGTSYLGGSGPLQCIGTVVADGIDNITTTPVTPAISVLLLATTNANGDCKWPATHITGYWDNGWINKSLAEDGDWNTAASVNVANKNLYANHSYDGDGQRFWKCKYSSSGNQYTYGQCYDYAAENWAQVWNEPDGVSGKTVTASIPSGCLKANQPIQLWVTSASSASYYEGEVLCEQ